MNIYGMLDDSICYMTSSITWLRYRKIPFALLYPSSPLVSHAQEPTDAVVQMLNHSCALLTLFLLGIITFLACPSEENFCMDFSFFHSHTTYRLNECWDSTVIHLLLTFLLQSSNCPGKGRKWATVRARFYYSPYHEVTETESKEELHNPWESQTHRQTCSMKQLGARHCLVKRSEVRLRPKQVHNKKRQSSILCRLLAAPSVSSVFLCLLGQNLHIQD